MLFVVPDLTPFLKIIIDSVINVCETLTFQNSEIMKIFEHPYGSTYVEGILLAVIIILDP